MNYLFSTAEGQFTADVYWDYDNIDDTFTDEPIVRQKILNRELQVLYVKVVVDCSGIKYENSVGGIIVEQVEELEKELNDQDFIQGTIEEFKTKLSQLSFS